MFAVLCSLFECFRVAIILLICVVCFGLIGVLRFFVFVLLICLTLVLCCLCLWDCVVQSWCFCGLFLSLLYFGASVVGGAMSLLFLFSLLWLFSLVLDIWLFWLLSRCFSWFTILLFVIFLCFCGFCCFVNLLVVLRWVDVGVLWFVVVLECAFRFGYFVTVLLCLSVF